MPVLGLKLTAANINFLHNINDYYSTNILKTNDLFELRFNIYRQVIFFNTSDHKTILFDYPGAYILSAKYQFDIKSDLMPLLHDIPKSININNTDDFIYYYINSVTDTTIIKMNPDFYNSCTGLIVVEFLKDYSQPIEIISDDTTDTTEYIINFDDVIDPQDLIPDIEALPITEDVNIDPEDTTKITDGEDEDEESYYHFEGEDSILVFTTKNLKRIHLELYYLNTTDPSNVLMTIEDDESNQYKILDTTNEIFPTITFIYEDAYNSPIQMVRAINEINIYDIDFLGWSSFTDQYKYLKIKSFFTDVKNCYFKKIGLEYSNVDIEETVVEVIIDFTQFNYPNDLKNYIRTLPVYVDDRLDQVQFYGLIEYYKRWKFGLAQFSINYLLSFTAKDLFSVTQEFYFASNESEFEILTSFDSKSVEEALIYIDILSIKSYDPLHNVTESINISNDRDNKLFTITKNLSDWKDIPKNNITFANYNGYIYNEYMYDGFWSKIILTYIH